MTIPLTQLQTWSVQGSVTQSKNTYATIRAALEDQGAAYKDRNFKIFLQGSYGNDTNIYAESDVDVVIRYDGAFFHDVARRPADEQAAFNSAFPNSGTYTYAAFKEDVANALRSKFGNAVTISERAIKINGSGDRRSADVIAAFEYRRYYKFKSIYDENRATGICLFATDGTRIPNYPKQHSEHLTVKHQATGNNFKPLVRIFKNVRSRLIDDGSLDTGSAPSYFIEGPLYNVPKEAFVGDYQDIFLKILTWLYETEDRTALECANEQYFLLRDGSPNCWAPADGENFINASIELWNNW
jgi:hypothetical protein